MLGKIIYIPKGLSKPGWHHGYYLVVDIVFAGHDGPKENFIVDKLCYGETKTILDKDDLCLYRGITQTAIDYLGFKVL